MGEMYSGFYLWVVFFGYFCLCSSSNEGDKSRQTFVIRYKDGEQMIPVTVVLDYKKQTEYVINMNSRTPAKSVTLYDFKQRTIAYKDLTNRECFLGRLTHETLNEEINALQDVKNPVEVKPKIRSLDPKRPALTPTEIRNIAGQKTAVFCRKMNTWLLMSERDHAIKKREAEEYEERTHHQHGHRSTQYSHFERHTRWRHRNKTNPKHRSQDKKSVAEDRIGRNVPEISVSPNSLQINSSRINYLRTSNSHLITTKKSQNPPSNSFINDYSSPQSSFGHSKETAYRKSSHKNNLLPSDSSKNTNNLGFYNHRSRYIPNEYASYSNRTSKESDYFNSNRTHDSTFLNYREPFESIINSSKYTEQIRPAAEVITENVYPKTAKTIEQNVPFLRQNDTSYPNVHPSLIHLLPLYKPLGQEFDFSRADSQSSRATFHPSNQSSYQSNIENEFHSISSLNNEQDNRFIHLTKEDNISHNPDVSVNVLEVPKITNKFENITGSIDQSQNSFEFLSSRENHSSVQQTQLRNTQHFENNHTHNFSEYTPIKQSIDVSNIFEDAFVNENNFHVSRLATSTTTPEPVITTSQYLVTERTLNSLHVPSVHTAFQNSEEFNSFQIFPDYIQSNISSPLERNLTTFPFQASKNNIFDEISGGTTDNIFSPTENPSTKRRYDASINHRSDIPSLDNNYTSLQTNHSSKAKNTYPSFVKNETYEVVTPYRRYQNALRDFKPDEIVIDVENIPNHTFPPATSSFQQRIFPTIQPTAISHSSNGINSNRNRHNELELRIAKPTTRYPRRRINHKTHTPLQNRSISYPRKVQNHHHSIKTRIHTNQHIEVNQYKPNYHTNKRQFHHQNQYNIPSQVRISTELNQLPQFSNINSLPPGVSMHPRHPQAPFADMIHSNRPPTIPIISDHQSPLKPHRQRHNRIKERHQNSCCRLRGTGAFQSCCRNGGHCCSKSQKRMQPQRSSCCSSQNTFGQIIPANHIQPLVRIRNQNLPQTKNEELPKTDPDHKDRCQKEKMCRTLYESTRQVMVCRNADVDGC